MSFETAKQFIDLLIEDSYKEDTFVSLKKTPGVIFEFIGGEPLLEIDLIYEIPNPTADVRREYFIKKEIDPEIITDLVKQTDGFSFAELKEVFIAVEVMGKPLEDVIKRIKEPFKSKDYLHKVQKIKGI